MKNRYQIRCKLKHKHYTDIINKYEEYYTNLKNIIRNIPYNKKKLLKHFPQNHFSTFDDFYTFTSKYKNSYYIQSCVYNNECASIICERTTNKNAIC